MSQQNPILSRHSAIRMLTESALMVALASVLAVYAVFSLPNGGSITIGSMIPIMLISFKYPFTWALATALSFSLIQMMTGFYAPPVATLLNYILMVLLDYVIAFGVLCLAGPLYRAQNRRRTERLRLMTAAIVCIGLRFICHFLSGLIIWDSYAPPDKPLWLYSLTYNGSFMLGEALITGVILFLAGGKLLSFLRERP